MRVRPSVPVTHFKANAFSLFASVAVAIATSRVLRTLSWSILSVAKTS